eukprot:GEMP01009157.1.p1 GENE.GEMP01009157.1~~GEMP01009157.1.p1  ORF type:complete len:1088 (+),score=230.50 GEMP01009157.1:69-3266(+)
MGTLTITSAQGFLAQLKETEPFVRQVALDRLLDVVDHFWAEIADCLTDIEACYEDPSFPHRNAAALLASRVYYHLEEYGDSLRLALEAGDLFVLRVKSEFVETIVTKAIDEYIRMKTDPKQPTINPKLENVVERMFKQCLDEKEFKQGLGIAIECRRLDRVHDFILATPDVFETVQYCMDLAPRLNSRSFRMDFFKMLKGIFRGLGSDNLQIYPGLCQCLFVLDDSDGMAEILKSLLDKGTAQGRLLAFQIAFDLNENENQEFLRRLRNHEHLKVSEEPLSPLPPGPVHVIQTPSAVNGNPPPGSTVVTTAPDEGPSESVPLLADPEPEAPAADVEMEGAPEPEEPDENTRVLRLLNKILSGRATIDANLAFLYRKNHTDLLLLDNIKASVDQRNSVVHNAIVMSHAVMQCGTTSDVFLRNNLEWMARATNWSKFSVTASLGVVHKGHIKEARSMLSTYLPNPDGPTGSPYSEGGAMFAMGLIHAGHHNPEAQKYLMEQLASSQNNEVLQHGSCLGLGLTAMATHDMSVYEELKQILFTDSAVAGEAAAYAIGLVMVGSKSETVIPEIVAYAHDTQHEKIIRGCAIALAMMMFRREEEAETLIQELLLDKDPILRYGACFTIAMAYCGTAENSAVRRLLHVSVSDVSDDVRRAAVLSLGFVMCNDPEQLPPLVKLLAESYNPHVRYAAAMALGICCAGTGMQSAYALLEPLQWDSSDFVRQGALLAIGFLLMQSNDKAKLTKFREEVMKVASSKHEDVITRFGAILAQGILDAGGRNLSVSFVSKAGNLRMGAAVGFMLYSQMWYWFPLINCLSLAMSPSCIIGLNEKLQIPKDFSFHCGVSPSTFAYPDPVIPPKKEESVKTTAVLSTLKSKKSKEKKPKLGVPKVEVLVAEGGDRAESVADSATAIQSQFDNISTAATHNTTVGSIAPSEIASEKDESMAASMAASMPPPKDEKKDAKMEDVAEQVATDVKMEDKDKDKDDKDKSKEEDTPKEVVKEPNFDILKNPARVLASQAKYITFDNPKLENQRYVPVITGLTKGIIMLDNTAPGEPEDVLMAEKKDDK